MNADNHDGLNCPECQAASEACKVMGGFAESLQKMLENGYFERLGYRIAYEREQRIIEAISK